MAGVNKATVNKLSATTVNRVFAETLPQGGDKPLQVLTTAGDMGDVIRAIHGAAGLCGAVFEAVVDDLLDGADLGRFTSCLSGPGAPSACCP